MGTIKIFGTFRAFINTRDEHYPAHIHIENEDFKNHARVFLRDGRIVMISGSFTNKQKKEIKEYVKKYKNQLAKEFDKMMHGKGSPKKIG